MDVSLFYKLNNLVGGGGFFDDLVIFLASPLAYLSVFAIIFVFIFPSYFTSFNREFSLRVGIIIGFIAAFFGRYVVKSFIVPFYNTPRPFEVLEEVNRLISHSGMESFPSGHAVFFFALSTALVLYNKKLGVFLFTSSVLMSLARVTAGLHWPSDVLAGASLGIIIGVAFYSVSALYVFSKLRIEEKVKIIKRRKDRS